MTKKNELNLLQKTNKTEWQSPAHLPQDLNSVNSSYIITKSSIIAVNQIETDNSNLTSQITEDR